MSRPSANWWGTRATFGTLNVLATANHFGVTMRLLSLAFLLFTACQCGVSSTQDGGTESGGGMSGGGTSGGGTSGGGSSDAGVVCSPACGSGSTCQVTATGPTCTCNQGFALDGGACVDLNECSGPSTPCPSASQCINLIGGSTCTCGPGQLWNGTVCEAATTRRIGAGSEHLCRIDGSGAMHCWGKNRLGQLGDGTTLRRSVMTPVTGGHVWKSVTVFRDTTCALDDANRAWCWGLMGGVAGAMQQSPTPIRAGTISDWVQLSLGDGFACGIRASGALFCWGSNAQGQLGVMAPFTMADAPQEVLPGTRWVSVSTGSSYTCAVKQDGSLWCWGQNMYGNLGDGTQVSRSRPEQVGTDTDWRSVDSGPFFTTCGTRQNGELWCWGHNTYGQVGASSTVPVRRSTTQGWRSVESGVVTTCGVRVDGTLTCWGRAIGSNDALLGQGQGGLMGKVVDVVVAEPAAIGRRMPNFACALTETGETWCWGQNNDGELALGSFGNKTEPARVGQATWSDVEGGAAYTCGVRADGALSCWGGGSLTTLFASAGQPALVQSPVPVATTTDFQAISAGAQSLCARKTDGSLWCGGLAFSSGALVRESSSSTWTSANLGRGFYPTSYWLLAAGIRSDGSLWTFNDNARPPASMQIGTNTDWQEISISRTHACGRRGGAIWCWTDSNATPRQIGSATDWQVVRTSAQTTTLSAPIPPMGYGIRADGSLWKWTFSGAAAFTPTPEAATQSWQTVDLGPGFICGIATDRSLWCWGAVEIASAINGDIRAVSAPVRVGTDADWATLKLGYAHLMATKLDGSLWTWGFGENGELGHDDSWRLTPVLAR